MSTDRVAPNVSPGIATMRLLVTTPDETVVDRDVTKVVADAENGSFGLLPRHIDFVAALVPGLLSFLEPVGPVEARSGGSRVADSGREVVLAVDAGILVKQGRLVRVAAHRAIVGDQLGDLNRRVARATLALEQDEQRARSSVARLEAGFVRRMMEVQEHNHGGRRGGG